MVSGSIMVNFSYSPGIRCTMLLESNVRTMAFDWRTKHGWNLLSMLLKWPHDNNHILEWWARVESVDNWMGLVRIESLNFSAGLNSQHIFRPLLSKIVCSLNQNEAAKQTNTNGIATNELKLVCRNEPQTNVILLMTYQFLASIKQ